MIGKTFLRLERDFDKHVNYCRDESNAQEFISNNDDARDFFEVNELKSSIFSTKSCVKALWKISEKSENSS